MSKSLRFTPADLPLREILIFRQWRRLKPKFFPLRTALAFRRWPDIYVKKRNSK